MQKTFVDMSECAPNTHDVHENKFRHCLGLRHCHCVSHNLGVCVCKRRLPSYDICHCTNCWKITDLSKKDASSIFYPEHGCDTSVIKCNGFVLVYRMSIVACCNLHSQQHDNLKSYSTALGILLFAFSNLIKVKVYYV